MHFLNTPAKDLLRIISGLSIRRFGLIWFINLACFFFFLQAAQAIVNGDEKDEDLIKDVPELQNLEAETAHNK